MRHRFHALCPYFAMFPETFAEKWIGRLTKKGEVVADPFCGRGTTPFQAVLMGRAAVACDVNPVAYCITRAKLRAPPTAAIYRRLTLLKRGFESEKYEGQQHQLPEFFTHAYHPSVLRQLLYLRDVLKYRDSDVDCMIAALVLGSLHGESERSSAFFSNQMPHTISTKPAYSVRFWKTHRLRPPKRDAFKLIASRVAFRYESEPPRGEAAVFQLDMRELARQIVYFPGPVRCAITSPPYFDVTSFEEDQWLRLWFLGSQPHPSYGKISRDDRCENSDRYWSLIADMWRMLGSILASRAHVVIRLGAVRIAPRQLVDALEGASVFCGRKVKFVGHEVSTLVKRQTDSFRPGSSGCKVEVDCQFAVT